MQFFALCSSSTLLL